jgi:pilus assembly protein CpaF
MVMRNLHLPDEWIPIRNQLVASLNQQIEQAHLPENILTTRVDAWIEQMVDQVKSPLTSEQRTLLTKQVLSEVIGYGPLQPLLDDEEISEIMVTGPQQVYIERDGELLDTGIKFKDDQHVLQIIDRIIRPLGRSVGREAPMVDARLPNGSRVNIVIPPCRN